MLKNPRQKMPWYDLARTMPRNYIIYKIYNFCIKFILYIFRFFSLLKKVFLVLLKALIPFLKIIGRLLFKVIPPLYYLYLQLKRVFIYFYSPLFSKHRLIHPFSRRYLVHIVIIIISLAVVTANLNANEIKKDDFLYSNVFTSIVGEEIVENFEEGPIDNGTKKITRYLGSNFLTGKSMTENVSEHLRYDIGAVTTGAIVKPIISPTELAKYNRRDIVAYTVQLGDTISYIAENFGISINTILWENKLTAYTIIRPGQQLSLLPTSGITYKVAKGDTLDKIGKKYKIDIEKIIDYNRLASMNDIAVGEKLIIPGGAPISIAPSYSLRSLVTSAKKSITGSGKYLWPAVCRRITQYFTWRHKGIDIACPYGSTVIASDGGTVIKSAGGWNGGYGLMVVVDHGNGNQTLYGHLSKLYVKTGDTIKAGQVIGAMGSSGRSTGSHVHFEVRSAGWKRNPFSYVR